LTTAGAGAAAAAAAAAAASQVFDYSNWLPAAEADRPSAERESIPFIRI